MRMRIHTKRKKIKKLFFSLNIELKAINAAR